MTKKEKVKKFIEEHKELIQGGLIATTGAVLLGSSMFVLGRKFENARVICSDTAAAGLALNKASNNVLMQTNSVDGLGKLSGISEIVAKGLKECAIPEGHLDDTVIGYMVYVKDNVKS